MFEKFRAKVFNLAVLNELDQPLDDLIKEIKDEFRPIELKGLKLLLNSF